jgi:hypothetical protein
MTRPHIEFIPSQVIPWTDGLYGGARPDVQVRILSMDADNGASSLVIKYPPGWMGTQHEVIQADEELFVLEGSLEIAGVTYTKHDYAHLPIGYPRGNTASPRGAVVLTFFSATPAATTKAADYDERRLVQRIDTRQQMAHQGPREHMASEGFSHSGTVHKSLFHDPDTDERSWLVGLPPYWSMTSAETHPVCEEEFAVYGDICMPNGVMHAGAYFWRPEYIQHGPFGTVGGTLHFCRAKGGAFSTEFEDHPERLDWNPEYRPILPDEYREYLRDSVIREPNY